MHPEILPSSRDHVARFRVHGMDYGIVRIPQDTLCRLLRGGTGDRWVVEDLDPVLATMPTLHGRKGSCFHHDATHYGIEVPDPRADVCTLAVGDAVLTVERQEREADGRHRYRWMVDLPGNGGRHHKSDLRSGCQGGTADEGMDSLLSFLSAAAEAAGDTGPDSNARLFPDLVTAWAAANSDGIAIIAAERQEGAAHE